MGIWFFAGSLMIRHRDNHRLVNRSLLFGPDGSPFASYDKIHMFDADVGDNKSYRESASFTAGSSPVIAMIGDVSVGLSICYDVRFHISVANWRLMVPSCCWFPPPLLRSAARRIGIHCFGRTPLKSGVLSWHRHNLESMLMGGKPMAIR